MHLLCLLALLLCSCQQDSTRAYRLSKSLDGDSMFVVDYDCHNSCRETEIRLLGIDSPEYSQDPWGKRAREFLLSQIHDDTKLFIETVSPPTDKYGRTLAFLYYANVSEKKFLNYEMLKNGYAQLFIISKDMKHATELKDAEAYARSHKLHIWQETDGLTMSPYKYRKLKFKKIRHPAK